MKFNILLLNGPNLNLLGTREKKLYGDINLKTLIFNLKKKASQANTNLIDFQSNAEHQLIEKIHSSKKLNIQYILFNPGAFAHTSIALRDALLAVQIPFFEIHITNIFSREEFRTHSWISDISNGVITGFGIDGYLWALKTAIKILKNKN
ncbi:type II 3-dehydroquinate dehydratase [Buchnera aphidicola]|uniref:3-dehydroquinate dehydratase n=1 Tax=Buchnera aphidicola subsp. Tuberolachnus salignus TaxID=98804 RepID=A0A160SYC3_BUCTT|nr:type II 3-dehydroquinate dehydratase [Buchnera aphidicola]CUR53244.1 3-dehydroquinate dehydratase [Buchnera aphidicola (Tuberolachnus salignus)]